MRRWQKRAVWFQPLTMNQVPEDAESRMIEEPPILTVKENQNRLPSDVIDQTRLYPTGFIVDAMDGSGAISHEIKAIGAPALSPKMCGSVLTCQCSPADNLGLLAALDEIQSGDVLVVATGPWTRLCRCRRSCVGYGKKCGSRGTGHRWTRQRFKWYQGCRIAGVLCRCVAQFTGCKWSGSGRGEHRTRWCGDQDRRPAVIG